MALVVVLCAILMSVLLNCCVNTAGTHMDKVILYIYIDQSGHSAFTTNSNSKMLLVCRLSENTFKNYLSSFPPTWSRTIRFFNNLSFSAYISDLMSFISSYTPARRLRAASNLSAIDPGVSRCRIVVEVEVTVEMGVDDNGAEAEVAPGRVGGVE
jgi:hypothetical protein